MANKSLEQRVKEMRAEVRKGIIPTPTRLLLLLGNMETFIDFCKFEYGEDIDNGE